MNHVFLYGEVSEIKSLDKAVGFKLNVTEWKKTGSEFTAEQIPVSVFLSGKRAENFEKYVKEGGEVTISGKLKVGKQGLYVATQSFDVGRLGPKQEKQQASTPKSSKPSPFESDDLPF